MVESGLICTYSNRPATPSCHPASAVQHHAVGLDEPGRRVLSGDRVRCGCGRGHGGSLVRFRSRLGCDVRGCVDENKSVHSIVDFTISASDESGEDRRGNTIS